MERKPKQYTRLAIRNYLIILLGMLAFLLFLGALVVLERFILVMAQA